MEKEINLKGTMRKMGIGVSCQFPRGKTQRIREYASRMKKDNGMGFTIRECEKVTIVTRYE